MVMKVLVITGSPHRKGTSALMAEKFIEGALKMGAQINRFDAAFANVHPCIGCDVCHCGENKCVFDDDMMSLYPKIQDADIIVYISPLYYHNISAQMKAVIDRYHGIDDLIRHKPKKVLSIITAAYPEDWVFDGVKAVIKTTTRYLGWKDCGGIYAFDCYKREDIEKTTYPKKAFELGTHIKEID